MEYIKKNYGVMVSLLLLFLFMIYILWDSNQLRAYQKTISLENRYVNIKIYHRDRKKVTKTFKNIEKIYQKYDNISSDKKVGNLKNVYYIRHNQEKEIISVDPTLYKMMDYVASFSKKNPNLYDIESASYKSIWEEYIKNTKIDPKEKIEKIEKESTIILLGNNEIQNTKPPLSMKDLSIVFASSEAEAYLKNNQMNFYLINADGNILVGEHYEKKKYSIALEEENHTFYQTLALTNRTISVIGKSKGTFTYENESYAKEYDPTTKMPVNYMQNIAVIGKDPILGHMIASSLYKMSIEDGKEWVKRYPGVDVVWQTNTGLIESTKGISNYEV